MAGLGEKLKKARLRSGLSQEEAAHQADVTTKTLSRLESGSEGNPTLSTISALAALYGLSIDDLAGITTQALVAPGDFSEAIEILSHFQEADAALKIAVLTLISGDERYLSAFQDPDRRRLASRKLHEFREFFET